MLKKIVLSLMIVLLLVPNFVSASPMHINTANINNGVVTINYTSSKGVAVRIMKDNKQVDHVLTGAETLPLTMGNGKYTIYVLEHKSGTSYTVVSTHTVNLNMDNQNRVFLQSVQNVKFNSEMEAIKKAKELTANAKTDQEKVEAIYKFIVNNVKYDYSKPSQVANTYIPTIDNTLKNLNGICYDYSSLFASMLRSQGIATKLVMGNKNDIKEFHAWNQVLLNGVWVTIDTTYDAGKTNVTMIKDASLYSVSFVY